MKLTLLEMTQNILSAMSSDEVNSIGDTAESLQVANIIQTVYYNIAARANLPEHNGLVQLVGVNDPLRPVLMTVPSNVTRINWIQYFDTNPADGASTQVSQFGAYSHDLNTDLLNNSTFQASYPWSTTSTTSNTIGLGIKTFTVSGGLTIGIGNEFEILNGTTLCMSGVVEAYFNTTLTLNVTAISGSGTFSSWIIKQLNAPTIAPGYKWVQVIPPNEFIKMVSRFNQTDSDVAQFNFVDNNGQQFVFNFKNDHFPTYCCFMLDQYVIFDSFDNTQDSSMNGSKTMCMAWFIPPFIMEDNFIPNLNDYQFPLLLSEAKSTAFLELKQMVHTKAEQETRRQWSNLQKNKSVTNKPTYFQQLPDYGRRLSTGGYATGYPYDWTRGYTGAPY